MFVFVCCASTPKCSEKKIGCIVCVYVRFVCVYFQKDFPKWLFIMFVLVCVVCCVMCSQSGYLTLCQGVFVLSVGQVLGDVFVFMCVCCCCGSAYAFMCLCVLVCCVMFQKVAVQHPLVTPCQGVTVE